MHDHNHASPAVVPPPPAQAPGAPPAAVGISPKAAAKLKEIMAAEKKDVATVGLRLGVQGGGCSGLSYAMDFDTKRDNDRVFTQDGVSVFVDPRSVLYLSGSILDYSEGLMGSGFTVKNPNVKSSCGCGSSFST